MGERSDIVRAALPGALENLIAAGLTAAGLDPISSSITGSAIGTIFAIDQAGMGMRLQRAGQVGRIAADILGGDDELYVAAMSSDERLELTVQVVEAAARTTMQDKIRALGRVLAQGLQDDAVDESRFIAAAIADLEGPHVQVLHLIHKEGRSLQARPAPLTGTTGFTEPELQRRLPRHEFVMPPILRVLTHHALIRDAGSGSYESNGPLGALYVTTAIGDRCLKLLEA